MEVEAVMLEREVQRRDEREEDGGAGRGDGGEGAPRLREDYREKNVAQI